LVALDIMVLAAWEALSAASRPASRILRRAVGLAAMAAAAAVNPAASISLLIAALAILSTVLALPPLLLLRLPPPDELEDLLREDLAISFSSLRRSSEKTLNSRNGSRMTAHASNSHMLKGTAASRSDALRHGQRPKVWPFRQRLGLKNTPLRPPC
jgi:hypothetical protein